MANHTKSKRELRAIGFQLADEIETRAQPRIAAGLSRDKAIMLTIAEMAGRLNIISC